MLTENDPKNVHMFRSGFIVTNHWKEQVGVRLLVCNEHGDKKVASSLFNGQVVSADWYSISLPVVLQSPREISLIINWLSCNNKIPYHPTVWSQIVEKMFDSSLRCVTSLLRPVAYSPQCRISVSETECAIPWIVIYPVDNVIHILNKWGLDFV